MKPVSECFPHPLGSEPGPRQRSYRRACVLDRCWSGSDAEDNTACRPVFQESLEEQDRDYSVLEHRHGSVHHRDICSFPHERKRSHNNLQCSVSVAGGGDHEVESCYTAL